MATRNTAKYGSELARLLNALAASPDNIVSTQDTLTDILEKVRVHSHAIKLLFSSDLVPYTFYYTCTVSTDIC